MSKLLFFPHMVKTTENLPNRIRELRQRKGRTMNQVAAAIGTSQAQLQRLEVGDRPLSVEWMARIAAALGVSPGELLHERDNPLLPSPRERELLENLRRGGEQAMRTAEAVAEAHRSFTHQPGAAPSRALGDSGQDVA